jgi:3-keto-disaccharide hydrolase
MRRHFIRTALAVALAGGTAVGIVLNSNGLSAQTGPDWVTLIDDKTQGEWTKLGESNWRFEDGAWVADANPSKAASYLMSKASYKDFQLYVEFWASDDANSGVFLRCTDLTKVNDHTCYEANIFDQRKDPTYGTGAIVHFVEVSPMPKAGGKWNTYEITVKGRQITVTLNGTKTAQLHNNLFAEGPIGLQHGTGTIKFRKVAVKPL